PESDKQDQRGERHGGKISGTEQLFPPENARSSDRKAGPGESGGRVVRRVPHGSPSARSWCLENVLEQALLLLLDRRRLALGHGLAFRFVLLDALRFLGRVHETLVGRG